MHPGSICWWKSSLQLVPKKSSKLGLCQHQESRLNAAGKVGFTSTCQLILQGKKKKWSKPYLGICFSSASTPISRSSSPLPYMELPAPFMLHGTEISMMLPRYPHLEWFTSALSHLDLGDAMVSRGTRELRGEQLWESCCMQVLGHICASSKAVTAKAKTVLGDNGLTA